MFPSESDLTICFAHVAYQLQQRVALRKLPIRSFGVRSREELDARIGEADVLVISGLWRDELTARARKLRFIQSVGTGTAHFDRAALKERGVTLRATEQPINTHSATGKAFLDMLGVFAEFETNLRRERQLEGIAAAKARGVYRGRKPSIDPAEIHRLRTEEHLGATAIARRLGIGRASVYRALASREGEP